MSSTEDQLALRDLMARYVDAVNRYDADAWIATWDEDAEWVLAGNVVSGRDNILALWRQVMESFDFALLMPNACLYELDGDSATGHWYLHEYTRDRSGSGSRLLSRYADSCVRRDGQWSYLSRGYHVMHSGPAELGGDFSRP